MTKRSLRVARLSGTVVLALAAASAPTPSAADPPATTSSSLDLEGVFTAGGLRYVEVVSGGASANEPLPMIVLLHGLALRPRMFAAVLAQFPAKARFILPYGFLPAGQGYEWFAPRTPTLAPPAQLDAMLPGVADQVATGLNAIRAARPTVGKIVLGGFSQGAEMTYGLALLHPEMFVRACPMSGGLTTNLLNRARYDGPKPEVHGFHGGDDPIVKTTAGQATIAAFSSLGYVADIKIYPGVGHAFLAATDDVRACVLAGARAAVASP